jgi:hypothetical protein
MRRDALTAEFAGVREQEVAVARAAVGENARTKLQRDPLTQELSYSAIRSRKRMTVAACHCPPDAVGILRRFSSAAACRADEAPDFWRGKRKARAVA